MSCALLGASLVGVLTVFGVRAKYSPSVYYVLAISQLAVVCLTAWAAGASEIFRGAEDNRRLALAGAIPVAAWALFAFLPGIGPPGDQTDAENALRYLILLIDSIAISGGLILVTQALQDAGERFYSTLGFGAIILAAPAYLVWAATALGYFRWKATVASSTVSSPGVALTASVIDILLFVGGALTYAASAAYAASLGRSQWISRTVARVCVSASFIALFLLGVRGLQFPVRSAALAHWSTIPGFVVGIPAIPWIMPVLFGVLLLRRAGNAHRESAA